MSGSDPTKSRSRYNGILVTISFVFQLFTKVPYHACKYLVPQWRPVPFWSYKAAFMTTAAGLFFDFLSKIRFSTPAISKSSPGFTIVEPGPANLYRGPLVHESIKPATLSGLWLTKSTDPSSHNNEWVVLHFHGGGYVLLSPDQGALQDGLRKFCVEIGAPRGFLPAYRLASKPGCTFPAQLQDAVSAYNHLLCQDIDSSRILISGDSAGGHLAVSFLRYLQNNPVLPKPRAAFLHSPWLNLTKSACTVENSSYAHKDYISTAFLQWGSEAFTPENMPEDSEFISPVFHPFSSDVPIWVQAGTAELLYPDVLRWVDEMKGLGNMIEMYSAPSLPHNLFVVTVEWNLQEEGRQAFVAAKNFLDRL